MWIQETLIQRVTSDIETTTSLYLTELMDLIGLLSSLFLEHSKCIINKTIMLTINSSYTNNCNFFNYLFL